MRHSEIKAFFAILLLLFSLGVSAFDKNEAADKNSHNPHSYEMPAALLLTGS